MMGKLIPSPKQWSSWSLPSKLTAIGALLAVVSLSLYGAEKAYNLSRFLHLSTSNHQRATVPDLIVGLENESEKAVNIAPTGEFVIWLPQGIDFSVRTIPGKFEFLTLERKPYDDPIRIDGHGSVKVIARFLNQEYFGPMMQTEDKDVSLVLRRENMSVVTTPIIDFRQSVFKSGYLPVNVAPK